MYRTSSRRGLKMSPEDWLIPNSEPELGNYNDLAFLEMGEQEVEDLGAAIRAELLRRAQ